MLSVSCGSGGQRVGVSFRSPYGGVVDGNDAGELIYLRLCPFVLGLL